MRESIDNDAAQLVGRTIRLSDNGRRQTEEEHTRLKVKEALFYTDDGIGGLRRLFDQVLMKTNVKKTVGMVCQLCRSAGVQSEQAYTQRMTGEGRSYKESQREPFNCP